tara:strand:- start:252 stop:500 length:249 start_codon:yes stop_codon:yes gene_type:complete
MYSHCEDPNRTDPPEEYRPLTRFLDRLAEPEDRYIDRPDDYLPMTAREIEAAKDQAEENNRLLMLSLERINNQHNKGRHRTK